MHGAVRVDQAGRTFDDVAELDIAGGVGLEDARGAFPHAGLGLAAVALEGGHGAERRVA
ncbi:hypothetical protein D3C78_1873570 [compost metagenome]